MGEQQKQQAQTLLSEEYPVAEEQVDLHGLINWPEI